MSDERKPKPREAKTATPEQWMIAKGHYSQGPRIGKLPRERFATWEHNVALTMHGWREHAHHEGAPIQLTEHDYDAAIRAASSTPPKPHHAARSKHAALKFGA